MKARLAGVVRGLADIGFPRVCVACGGLAEAEPYRHLCGKCSAQLDFVQAPACLVCGHPFYGELAEGERICPHCVGLAPAFREGRTCVLFKGPVRALVHELKYHRGLYTLDDMETVIRNSPRVLELVRDAVLVPVPLHSRKERERGYNQTHLIAQRFAAATGGTARVEHLLRRVIDTASQTAFDRRTRRTNLKNAFALVRGAALNPAQHYVLVDDVFTTGSTLNSCAGVLRRAGCLKLDVVTLGHG